MIRLFVFLLFVLALGFGFAWFADRPGEVTLVWQGMEFQTSLMVVITALVVLVATIMIAWWIVSVILRSPSLMRRFYRNRQRDRGYYALSQGLIAASAGDSAGARRLSRDSRKLLGSEPLVQLLEAQTLLLEGKRGEARERFTAMLDDDDTKLVALRGLYMEAEREGEKEASRHYAEEAARLAPSLGWAANAVLKHQTLTGDFESALRTLENNRAAGLVDKAVAARRRAVLLTAQAMAEEQAHPDKAAKLAAQAHKLAPDLIPAAIVGARAYARLNDLKRGAGLLEAAWKKEPHPDIADTYVHLRHGDSGLDRLKRARKLASMRFGHPQGAFAVAEAAIAVKDWEAAREAMKPVLLGNPTQRACTLMSEIEEGQYGDKGRMRDWLARAVRAPRDPVWIADGYASRDWLPISPVTGELDAFEWKVPVAMIGAALEAEDLTDLAAPMQTTPAGQSEPELLSVQHSLSGPAVSEPVVVAAAEAKEQANEAEPAEAEPSTGSIVAPPSAASGEIAAEAAKAEEAASSPAPKDSPAQPAAAALPLAAIAVAASGGGSASQGNGAKDAITADSAEGAPRHSPAAEPVEAQGARVFALDRPPDDPGIDPEEPVEQPKKAFRLF